MTKIAAGRGIRSVTYFTLPDAAWNRRPGLHDLDYGLDLDLDGEVRGVIWGQRDGTLDIVDGSLREQVPLADYFDVSSITPWDHVVGSPLVEVRALGLSVLRLTAKGGQRIWMVAGNYVDDSDEVRVCGDSVLIVHDINAARLFGLK